MSEPLTPEEREQLLDPVVRQCYPATTRRYIQQLLDERDALAAELKTARESSEIQINSMQETIDRLRAELAEVRALLAGEYFGELEELRARAATAFALEDAVLAHQDAEDAWSAVPHVAAPGAAAVYRRMQESSHHVADAITASRAARGGK